MSIILSKKIFFLFFIVSFSQLFADIVYLKNGKKIEGKIVNQSRTQIQIDINGKLELIDKQNINKIEFENLEERKKQEELKRQQEEERKKQEELKRQQEEERKKQEELKRQQEEERKKQEELKRQQEEERKKQEELKRQQEEERKKQEELKRKQEIKPPNTESVYLKTVVLPGWGEYSINNYYRSAIWGGLFWISLGATISEINKLKTFQKAYNNLNNLYQVSPPDYEFYFISQINNKKSLAKSSYNKANGLATLTILVYFLQFPFLYYDLREISYADPSKPTLASQIENIHEINLLNIEKNLRFGYNNFYPEQLIFIYESRF
jgi:flagellar biosynthesis GTPase FlhF